MHKKIVRTASEIYSVSSKKKPTAESNYTAGNEISKSLRMDPRRSKSLMVTKENGIQQNAPTSDALQVYN